VTESSRTVPVLPAAIVVIFEPEVPGSVLTFRPVVTLTVPPITIGGPDGAPPSALSASGMYCL
jgi:hypothetical protein